MMNSLFTNVSQVITYSSFRNRQKNPARNFYRNRATPSPGNLVGGGPAKGLLFRQFLTISGLTLIAACLATLAQAQVSGTVFRDFNGNGIRDINEPLLAGITIKAYNPSGSLCGTSVSTNGTATPNYSVTGCGTGAVRVEFSIPATGECVNSSLDYTALGGAAYGSSIQFVSGNSTNVNFAVHDPTDYNTGAANTQVFIPCYVSGDPLPSGSASGAADWLVGFPYTRVNTTTVQAPTQKVNGAKIGSVWGIAYSKQANKFFTSAFLKRHVGLGQLGSGGIYLVQPTATSFNITNFYDMDANGYRTRAAATAPAYGQGTSFNIAADNSTITYLGTTDPESGQPSGLGVIGSNTQRGLTTNPLDPSYDPAAFDQVGKVGLGDIDISDDGKYLFVMNLYSRKVYRLTLDDPFNPTTVIAVSSFSVPNPQCGSGTYRPWGLKYHRGKLYVGLVCSGETNGQNTIGGSTNVYAYVYAIQNPTGAASFLASPLVQTPLNYNRNTTWKPWTNNSAPSTNTLLNWPEPIVSDIEIDERGDIILGLMDREAISGGFGTACI